MSCLTLQAAACFAGVSDLFVRLSHHLAGSPSFRCCNCQSECCDTDEQRLAELLDVLLRVASRLERHPSARHASTWVSPPP